MPATAFETVSQIASILSTHLVVSSALPYKNAAASSSSSSSSGCKITKLFPHVDPASLVGQNKSSTDELTTLLLAPTSSSLSSLLPSLSTLASTPLVVHLSLPRSADLGPVLGLRGSGWVVLKSENEVEAGDGALLASKLAKEAKRAVLHVYAADLEVEGTNGHSNGNGHTNGSSSSSSSTLPSEEEIGAFFQAETIGLNGASASHASVIPHVGQHLNDVPQSDVDLFTAYEAASLATLKLTRRAQKPFHYTAPKGGNEARVAVVVFGLQTADIVSLAQDVEGDHVGVLQVDLLRPLAPGRLLGSLPASVEKVVVLEQAFTKSTRWGAVFLDVLSALQARSEVDESAEMPQVIGCTLGQLDGSSDLARAFASVLKGETDVLGSIPDANQVTVKAPHVPQVEEVYTNILDQTFPGRLEIANSPSLVPSLGELATRPEYAFGKLSALLDERDALAEAVKQLLKEDTTSETLHKVAARWLVGKDGKDSKKIESMGQDLVRELSAASNPSSSVSKALELKAHVKPVSRWIIGSDAWSYDLGSSGIHHAIASGKNVNMLIIDTQPYTTRGSKDAQKRKKDIGLYAMNHGDVYVASVAVYSSYSQVLQAFAAADAFPGPSIVLAYLPYGQDESATALQVLKETKLAVDNAYWPLYRWDPSQEDVEGGKPFLLDSVRVKEAMKDFLDQQNHLSQLTAAEPQIAKQVVASVGTEIRDARRKKAKEAYEKLMNAMDGPPLLILYASDGGNAEKVAKKLASRAKTRGLATRLVTMDEFAFDDIKLEGHVVFFTSTAGQGEAPQNGRTTFKALMAAGENGEWENLNFTVFGMGDSHYWPGEDGAKYYNKPAKEIDGRLEKLGAKRMADIGLGDDQDPDGAQTGYKIWEPLLWKAMGVDSVEVLEAEPEPITNENIKIASNYLRGTILEGLADKSTGAIDPSDAQLTKFHGTYMQDDRDIREERKDQGLEPAYSFMIRCRMPGGVCKPEQWLAIDQISDEHGNGTFKLTTRQTFQFHGIIKKHLKPAMQAINRTLLDTIAACGDVNRNVQLSVNPSYSKLHEQVYDFSKALSEHLLPSTTAYHEIWLDKKLVAGEAVKDFEPLYGPYYLPRKFKIAVAVPPDNSVDVFTNDVGFIAITDALGELAGFNVTVGGGMGVTHSNKKTYPRLGDVIGFVTPEEGCLVAEKIMLSQRDNGNRADRKNARLKYTVDRMGLENFKADVEKRLGHALEPAREYKFEQNVDNYGWIKGHNGKWHFTMFIENGRVEDNDRHQFKTGLREIASVHKGDFRLTANQHCILSDVAEEDKPEMERLLAKWKLDQIDHSGLRLSSSACVAFPTW